MAFFSKMRRAKKAADEHKKASEEADKTKPKPVPYKHIPVHAAQDALSATPTRWSPQETRARIAEARRRHSEMIASAPASVNHSRANSELNFPVRPMPRSKSDLSIATMMSRPQSYQPSASTSNLRAPIPPMPTIPQQHQMKSSDNLHAASAPRDAPSSQSRRQRPLRGHRSASSISSTTRRKSPLSNVSVEEEEEEEEYPDHHDSNTSNTPTDTSSASSFEGQNSRSNSRESQSRVKMPTLPMPKFASHGNSKQSQVSSSTMEISMPYSSNEDLADKSPANSIPTWRYEDFALETEPPVLVDSIVRTHSRSSSISRGIFTRRAGSFSVAAH